MRPRVFILFLLAEVLAGWLVFGGAWRGRELLAPLDIAPALFSKYGFVDPGFHGVPANHHVIDQLTYDLPIQHTVYQAYRRHEIPWWDPYTYAGRPLLADAHINGTDPIRVSVYQVLPFALAYNWTRIVHFFLTGLGLFLLLRHWRFGVWTSIGLALTGQYAGCQALFFGHPWIQASFLYYPFLWLIWDDALRTWRWWQQPLTALGVAGIFYAGNLQSHAYLLLFVLAFGWGYAPGFGKEWRKAVRVIGPPLLMGAALAAPVLLGQMEFFKLGVRSIEPERKPLAWLSGVASMSAAYPWILGTFRTLDIGKFISQSGLGFHLFIGSAGLFLAMIGGIHRPSKPEWAAPRRTALALVILYFLVLSSPLLGILYTRCAALAVMGLILLVALGLEQMAGVTRCWRSWGYGIVLTGLLTAFLVNVGSLLIYPRLLPKVEELVRQRDATNPALDTSPALRDFQVRNLPNEVSFRNPVAVCSWLGWLALGGFCLGGTERRRPLVLGLLVGLNLVPVLWFSQRFIPRQPILFWERLQMGGPAQQEVVQRMGGTPWRLLERAPGVHDQLFPNAMSHLYRVRTVHGYSALQPKCLFRLTPAELARCQGHVADFTYDSKERGAAAGVLQTNSTTGLARFQWQGDSAREFQVVEPDLNTIRLLFAPGPAGTLVWSDTYYPGWTAWEDGRCIGIKPLAPCFSQIEIAADCRALRLVYRPRYLRVGECLAVASLIMLLLPAGANVTRRLAAWN